MKSDPVYLPVGNYYRDFLNEAEMSIVDTLGDNYKLIELVKVMT